MKAAVCYELGQPLVVEDVVLDPPRAGEVRVRIDAVAICHSDVHLVRGQRSSDRAARLATGFVPLRRAYAGIGAKRLLGVHARLAKGAAPGLRLVLR